jgi:hypothetical protein
MITQQDLTTKQAALALGITHSAVRKALDRGILASRLEETGRGPLRLVAPAEVERYRREHLGKRGRPATEPTGP